MNVMGDGGFHVESKLKTALNGTDVDVVVDKSKVVPLPGEFWSFSKWVSRFSIRISRSTGLLMDFAYISRFFFFLFSGAFKTTFTINGVHVETYDVPALNGAVHVLEEVLKPKHEFRDEETGAMTVAEWENWER